MVWMSHWWFEPWRPDEQRVHCPRTERMRQVTEHLLCPYCYGSVEDVETGRRQRFCDYDPETDPVSFGFPDGGSRIRCT